MTDEAKGVWRRLFKVIACDEHEDNPDGSAQSVAALAFADQCNECAERLNAALSGELDRLKAEIAEARRMADSLCLNCEHPEYHSTVHLADVMEKHVFRAGQADGRAALSGVSSPTEPSEEAIETAAKAAYGEYSQHRGTVDWWDELPHSAREEWRYIAVAVLGSVDRPIREAPTPEQVQQIAHAACRITLDRLFANCDFPHERRHLQYAITRWEHSYSVSDWPALVSRFTTEAQ